MASLIASGSTGKNPAPAKPSAPKFKALHSIHKQFAVFLAIMEDDTLAVLNPGKDLTSFKLEDVTLNDLRTR